MQSVKTKLIFKKTLLLIPEWHFKENYSAVTVHSKISVLTGV